VVLTMAVIALVDAAVFGGAPFDLFSWSGTIGTLILIVVYVLATVGAVRLLFFSGPPRVNRAEIVIPVLALLVLARPAMARRAGERLTTDSGLTGPAPVRRSERS
jgi:hypothetical protein